MRDGVALAALDIAEDRKAGRRTRLRNGALSSAIDDLRRRLGAKRLFARP